MAISPGELSADIPWGLVPFSFVLCMQKRSHPGDLYALFTRAENHHPSLLWLLSMHTQL